MSQMFDGHPEADSTIDASRWAKSAGLDTRCAMSLQLIEAVAPPGTRERMGVEDVAAVAMAVLDRVRREMDGSDGPVRFTFKAGTNGPQQALEAAYVSDDAGRLLLVRTA